MKKKYDHTKLLSCTSNEAQASHRGSELSGLCRCLHLPQLLPQRAHWPLSSSHNEGTSSP